MEAISRSCLPAAAARTKRQRKATCCGVLGTASHRTTCARSSTDKLTSGLILAMRTYISYSSQYVYLFMIHTTNSGRSRTLRIAKRTRLSALTTRRCTKEDTDDGRQKPCIGGMTEFGAAVLDATSPASP